MPANHCGDNLDLTLAAHERKHRGDRLVLGHSDHWARPTGYGGNVADCRRWRRRVDERQLPCEFILPPPCRLLEKLNTCPPRRRHRGSDWISPSYCGNFLAPMNADYFNRLTLAVQHFVREVEAAAGIEIEVEIDARRAGRGPDGRGILACDIDEDGATILVPSTDYFPDSAVVHEVLHIRRILVDGVPRLSDNTGYSHWNPQIGSALTDLDNALEHLVIVPEQLERCPESRQHWEQVMARVWQTDLLAIVDFDDQRRWALMHWAFLVIVLPDSPVVAIAQKVLRGLGFTADAERFVDAVKPLLRTSKPALLRTVFEILQLPPDIAVLEYIDALARQTNEVSLSDA